MYYQLFNYQCLPNEAYVYIYLDPRKPGLFVYDNLWFNFEPFYIGKGRNRRALSHIREANKNINNHKLNIIRKIKESNLNPIIYIIKDNLSDNDAYKLEQNIISIMGRIDQNMGPLANKTDGGDGLQNPSYETRKNYQIFLLENLLKRLNILKLNIINLVC